ncbi:hypothetical protein J3R83DRAFT_10985 [Lanmaoa asiatica]|nr:hypothetical protein J3R83DRAFT_10985 [Lanmaoa asiatica]
MRLGLVHLALGQTEEFVHSEEAATGTLVVVGAGALTVGTGGAAAPILAGVAAGIVADAAITGIESARHQKYEPQGYLGAVSEFKSDWRGGVFDITALAVGDAVIGSEGAVTKAKYKTTTVFRVEGEGIFLSKKGKVIHGANSRLFAGPGGRVIESSNTIKLLVPPEDELKVPGFKDPAVLCLNIGDTTRAEAYYAQKLMQYREAVEKLRSNVNPDTTSLPHATEFRFNIKSFRILSSDAEKMFRDVPKDGQPSPTGVRRVDLSKTSKSFECPQPVYSPLIEMAIQRTFEEAYPTWLVHLPTRLLEAMRDRQVAYGRVRTVVIAAYKFTKLSLSSDISSKITDQELNRLQHGPISLSALSQQGIDSTEVRMEPVRRLRQSREVKCGRKLVGDIDHGRHMEYLAEFSDGSTSWIPSYNVALDLKEEYWKVTVKRPDGTTEVIDQTKIFWKEEKVPTMLTDAELEAILHHGHFGIDIPDFMPCTVTVAADWGKVEILSVGAVFMKDPAAEKAGEYVDVEFDQRSMKLGKEGSYNFISRNIPLFIVGNGAPIDIKVTHGTDGSKHGDRDGKVVLGLPDASLHFVVAFNLVICVSRDASRVLLIQPTLPGSTQELSKFVNYSSSRPVIITGGLLSVETDWGAIEINSKLATIDRDPTVDQNLYNDVTFTPTSMKLKLNAGVFDKKSVIPFVFSTRDEKIDITITHGRDKSRSGDELGQAKALFGQVLQALAAECEFFENLFDLNGQVRMVGAIRTFDGSTEEEWIIELLNSSVVDLVASRSAERLKCRFEFCRLYERKRAAFYRTMFVQYYMLSMQQTIGDQSILSHEITEVSYKVFFDSIEAQERALHCITLDLDDASLSPIHHAQLLREVMQVYTFSPLSEEDIAYSLLEIFSNDINPQYGFGKTALGQLLENIVDRTGDVTVIS